MSALPSPNVLLRLLVPPAALPPEDDDMVPPFAANQITQGLSRSLGWFQQLAGPHAVLLRLKGTELEWPDEPSAALTLIELEENENGLGIDATPAGSSLSWAGVAEAYARRTDPEHFSGGPAEAQRVLLDEIRHAARQAVRHFAGEALPLVEVRHTGTDTTELAFLGVWLGEAGDARHLSGLPSRRWNEVTPAPAGILLVLDEPDAEGHLLREAVMSLSMLSIVFTSQRADAAWFSIRPAPPEPVAHESKATVDGTPLLVKSQKLVQSGPKIYPSGLAGQPAGTARKVIVDIKAQRAYLFVGGKLAFETPVSTASKGRVTPRGTFSITEKIRTGKRSTLYKCKMPYWNRLDQSAIGMHTGHLPGYPASHGCIRMPDESARFIFDNASRGTTVHVVDALDATPLPTPAAPANTLMASASPSR